MSTPNFSSRKYYTSFHLFISIIKENEGSMTTYKNWHLNVNIKTLEGHN